MADKARFAQLINQRLAALDRSAGWLARTAGTSEANVSRWRNDAEPSMPHESQARPPAGRGAGAGRSADAGVLSGGRSDLSAARTAADGAPCAGRGPIIRPGPRGRLPGRPAHRMRPRRRGPIASFPNYAARPRFNLLSEADGDGVYVPLRFDLHRSRPARTAERAGRDQEGKRQRPQSRDLSRANIPLADVLTSPGHVVFIGAAGQRQDHDPARGGHGAG